MRSQPSAPFLSKAAALRAWRKPVHKKRRPRTAKRVRPAVKGGRRTPLSCAKHLPTNRLIVSTGSLYGKSKVRGYLAVACPLGDGRWGLSSGLQEDGDRG